MTPGAAWSGLVDVKWMARHLGITEKRVRELARRGELKALRIGKSWRFDPRDLEGGRAAEEQPEQSGGTAAAERPLSIAANGSLTAALSQNALDERLAKRTVESVVASLSDPDTALPEGVTAAAVELSDHHTFVLRTAPGTSAQTARDLIRELARALKSEP